MKHCCKREVPECLIFHGRIDFLFNIIMLFFMCADFGASRLMMATYFMTSPCVWGCRVVGEYLINEFENCGGVSTRIPYFNLKQGMARSQCAAKLLSLFILRFVILYPKRKVNPVRR